MPPKLTSNLLRLQVLLSKRHLSARERALGETLAAGVTDWRPLVAIGARTGSLPLLKTHLNALDTVVVPTEARRAVGAGADRSVINNMLVAATLRSFAATCLDPLGIDGIFFKGISLGVRYYGDIGLRPSRDLDVLVPGGTMRAVLERTAAAGYGIVLSDGTVRRPMAAHDIDALMRFGRNATLRAPSGVVVDLQSTLDKNSELFAAIDIFETDNTFVLGDRTFRTLSDDLYFNYLCHHHARHAWSHLYWLSDLDAFAAAEDFDCEAALAMAHRLGQTGTVEASLELRALMSSPAPWPSRDDLPRGRQFLQLALRNVTGDAAVEKQIALHMMGGEFMFHWQVRPELIRRARISWLKRTMQPTYREYTLHPLPKRLQWLYFLTRFAHLFRLLFVRLVQNRHSERKIYRP